MNRRRWIVLVSLVSAGGLSLAAAETKYYFLPKRFHVVEAGEIYRGGWQKPNPLRRILVDHHIKTVLNVACNPPEQDAAGEGAVVRELGVGWHKILMPGTGCGTFEQLDEAADVIADPANRPIFVHCAAGVHRTNTAIAAFRIKHCGWSVEQAFAEMGRYGFDPKRDGVQMQHLRRFVSELRANELRVIESKR